MPPRERSWRGGSRKVQRSEDLLLELHTLKSSANPD
jgi:hypothetical protein